MSLLTDALKGSGMGGIAALAGIGVITMMAACDIDLCEKVFGDVSLFLHKQRGQLPDDFWGNDGDEGGSDA